MTIAVIDLGVSNVRSVVRAFGRIGVDVELTTTVADVEAASVIVLPGVGAFRDGMARLHDLGLVEPLRRAGLERGVPVAGICLGMQLLADESLEHGRHEGLGLVPGRVVPLIAADDDRVPNVGWCDLHVERSSPLVAQELDGRAAYFVHSFHVACEHPGDVVATIDHGGQRVAAALERGHFLGVQFHPEKSQDAGLTVLDSLVRLAAGRVAA